MPKSSSFLFGLHPFLLVGLRPLCLISWLSDPTLQTLKSTRGTCAGSGCTKPRISVGISGRYRVFQNEDRSAPKELFGNWHKISCVSASKTVPSLQVGLPWHTPVVPLSLSGLFWRVSILCKFLFLEFRFVKLPQKCQNVVQQSPCHHRALQATSLHPVQWWGRGRWLPEPIGGVPSDERTVNNFPNTIIYIHRTG